ncbi:MAG TPA: ABC transporter ATP-binding protein [Elusimicrobiota bacterium]|nr:ABC transporter ATP-binding protein [Elusimicrobiota bacterium]
MFLGVEVRDLHKKLGAQRALAGFSSDFSAGALHGVIGPDGAGKTTLLRLLAGLLRPDAGEIVFTDGGRPAPFASVRPTLAYMPQQQSLYPDLTCSEHLDFFRDLYRLPKDVYRERRGKLLHLTRLEPFQSRRAGQLSGGMYKKLGLMCALLQSPSAVLLDEPTNGVDPVSRREFWELLYGLVERKTLVVVSTAYMDEAERCGVVHLMDAGRRISSGEPRALLEKEGASGFDEIFRRRAAEARR